MAGISKEERERRAAAAQASGEQVADETPAVQLVRMVRSPNDWPAPHTADIHPDEVANAVAGGWRLAD